jgi:8-oxo-dGTP pyrophosphatase MutT (NUDIX family)
VESAKLIHRGKLYIFPAGGIDPGEDPLTAAIRETEEEAGALGRVISELGVSHD